MQRRKLERKDTYIPETLEMYDDYSSRKESRPETPESPRYRSDSFNDAAA